MLSYVYKIIIMLCLYSPLLSQETIGGKVLDTQSNGLNGAAVYVKNIQNSKIIAYGFTDNDGRFNIDISAIDRDTLALSEVVITYLGFSKNVYSIEAFFNGPLEIRLKPDNTFDEIVIKAPMQHIAKNKDTITYNLQSFVDSSEVVVQDILEKLPGVSIDDNGLILYRGKKIKTVLIEESNMFGGQYNILTHQLNADHVQSIQVFNNYNENTAERKVLDSREIALNIRLKENRKNLWIGNVLTGTGAGVDKELKYMLDADIFNISKFNKTIFLSNLSNTGQVELTNPYEENGADLQVNFDRQIVESVSNINNTFHISPLEFTDNSFAQSHAISHLRNFTKSTTLKLKGNLLGINDSQLTTETLRYQDFSRINTTLNSVNNLSPNFSAEIKHNALNQSFFLHSLVHYGHQHKKHGLLINRPVGDPDRSVFSINHDSWHAILLATKSFKDHNLISIKAASQQGDIDDNATYHNEIYNNLLGTEKGKTLNQRYRASSLQNILQLDFLMATHGGNSFFKSFNELRHTRVNKYLRQQYIDPQEDALYDNNVKDNFNLNLARTGVSWQYIKESINFKVLTDINHYDFSNEVLNQTINLWEAGLRLENNFWGGYSYLLNINYSQNLENYNNYNRFFYLNDMFSATLNTPLLTSSSAWRVSLFSDYSEPLGNSYFSLKYNYEYYQDVPFFNISSSDDIILSQVANQDNFSRHGLYAHANFSYYKLKLGLIGNATLSKRPSVRLEDRYTTLSNLFTHFKFNVASRLNKFYRGKLVYNLFSSSFLSSGLLENKHNIQHRVSYENYLYLEDWKLQFDLFAISNSGSGATSSMNISLHKEIEMLGLSGIEFNIYNLFNRKQITSRYISEFFTVVHEIEMIPLYAMIKVDFNLN